jgi:hypothetical protein
MIAEMRLPQQTKSVNLLLAGYQTNCSARRAPTRVVAERSIVDTIAGGAANASPALVRRSLRSVASVYRDAGNQGDSYTFE